MWYDEQCCAVLCDNAISSSYFRVTQSLPTMNCSIPKSLSVESQENSAFAAPEPFCSPLIDQALTSFYSWYPSVLSLYRKSLMPVIWVEYIAPSNMLRIDHSIFISTLFSHILHNTAFRGVGLMNQIWFFVASRPIITLCYVMTALTHEKTPPFCPA